MEMLTTISVYPGDSKLISDDAPRCRLSCDEIWIFLQCVFNRGDPGRHCDGDVDANSIPIGVCASHEFEPASVMFYINEYIRNIQ